MRKTLKYTIGVLSLLGLVFVVIVFGTSMQPSTKAKFERSQHDITTLALGQYRIEPFGRGSAWNELVLVIKDWDAKHYVYILPTEKGKVVLPDRWWGGGYYNCSEFRPEIDETGLIQKDGIIKCHDKETPEWGAPLWKWTYNGDPKDEWGVQMYSPPVEVVDGTLYINR